MLNTSFLDHLTSQGAHPMDSLVEHFGDPEGERTALGQRCTLHPLAQDGLMRVIGADAKVFLQGQLSNDIGLVDQDRAQLTTWCTAQGRMLATFLAWRDRDAYLLQLPGELAGTVCARLRRFVMRARVDLAEATVDWVLLGLGGPGAAEVLAAIVPPPVEPMAMAAGADGTRAVMLATDLYQLAVPSDRARPAWEALSHRARPAGTRGWDWLRIRACLPTITAATQDQFVPQMLDLEHLGAVSFDKGCYPGQEVVARAQYRGQVKRRLFRIHADAALHPGQELDRADGAAAGMVLNAAPAPVDGSDALAVIQVEAAGAADLALRATGARVRILGPCH